MTDLTDSAVEADRFTAYKEIDTGYRAVRWHEKTLYEQSRPGTVNDILPAVVRWHEKTLYEQSRPGTVNDILPAVEPALAAETEAVLDGLPVEARDRKSVV